MRHAKKCFFQNLSDARKMLLTGAVELNVLAEGTLRRFTEQLWIEQPNFQLRGGHCTTELSPPQQNVRCQCLGVR